MAFDPDAYLAESAAPAAPAPAAPEVPSSEPAATPAAQANEPSFDPDAYVKDSANGFADDPDFDAIGEAAKANLEADPDRREQAWQAYRHKYHNPDPFSLKKTLDATAGGLSGLWSMIKGVPKLAQNVKEVGQNYASDLVAAAKFHLGDADDRAEALDAWDDNDDDTKARVSEMIPALTNAGKGMFVDLPVFLHRNAVDAKNWVTGKKLSDDELRNRFDLLAELRATSEDIVNTGGIPGVTAGPEDRAAKFLPHDASASPEANEKLGIGRQSIAEGIREDINDQTAAASTAVVPMSVFNNPVTRGAAGAGLRVTGGVVQKLGQVAQKTGNAGALYGIFSGNPGLAVGSLLAKKTLPATGRLLTEAGDAMFTGAPISGNLARRAVGATAQNVATEGVAGAAFAMGADSLEQAIGETIGEGLSGAVELHHIDAGKSRGQEMSRRRSEAKDEAKKAEKVGVLREFGEQLQRSNPAHAAGMAALTEKERSTINYAQGFLAGRLNADGGQIEISVLPESDFAAVQEQLMGHTGRTRGFVGPDGNIYLNAGITDEGGITRTQRHETGHVVERLAEIMGEGMAASLRDSITSSLYDSNGRATPEFRQFIASYQAGLGKKISRTVAESEFIAETVNKILEGKPLEEWARKDTIGERVRMGVSDAMKRLGLAPKGKDGVFSWQESLDVTKRLRDTLRAIGKGAIGNATAPKPAPASNAVPPPVTGDQSGQSSTASDHARNIHVEDGMSLSRGTGKRSSSERDAARREKQLSDEWDQLFAEYELFAAANEIELPTDPRELHQAVISHSLGANQPRPKPFPTSKAPAPEHEAGTPHGDLAAFGPQPPADKRVVIIRDGQQETQRLVDTPKPFQKPGKTPKQSVAPTATQPDAATPEPVKGELSTIEPDPVRPGEFPQPGYEATDTPGDLSNLERKPVRILSPSERKPEGPAAPEKTAEQISKEKLEETKGKLDERLRGNQEPEKPAGKQVTDDEITDRLNQAEEAAKASPEYAKKRKESTRAEHVKKARTEALLEAVHEASEYDPSLLQRRTEYGEEKWTGRIDEENPAHLRLLEELGIPRSSREKIDILTENLGKTVNLDYQSAKKDVQSEVAGEQGIDRTGKQRSEEYRQSTAQDRVNAKGDDLAALAVQHRKAFVPMGFRVNPGTGSITVTGFSPQRLLANAKKLIEFAKSKNIAAGYADINDPQLVKDLQSYARNHANGYKGDGSGPLKLDGLRVNPDYEPATISQDRFHLLNAAFKDERSTASMRASDQGRKVRGSTAAKESESHRIATENDGYLNPETGEVNPFRDAVNRAGFEFTNEAGESRRGTHEMLEDVIESLKPELMSNLDTAPQDREMSIRATGFKGDLAELAIEGVPKHRAVGSGFMPETDAGVKPSFKEEGKFYRVIVGDEAFQDIVDSGLVRTNANNKTTGASTMAERLKARPTASPSFSKGEASMEYAANNPNHYIVVSSDTSIQPSTQGRHGKGSTHFPTIEGKSVDLPGGAVEVYKHLGNGEYALVYNKGKKVELAGFAPKETGARFMPSSSKEGELSNFEKSKKVTDSPEFKKWFGKSKVTNEDGSPKVVVHGSASPGDFTKFKRRPGDIGIHFGDVGQANDRLSYVSEKRGEAGKEQGAPRAYPVFLKIERPIRLSDAGSWSADNLKWQLLDKFPNDKATIGSEWGRDGLKTPKQIREFLQSKGYDGIVYRNDGEVEGAQALRDRTKPLREAVERSQIARKKPLNSFDKEDQDTPEYKAYKEAMDAEKRFRDENAKDSYIAFEPNQIKSAIGNSGAFDPKNPDIRFMAYAGTNAKGFDEAEKAGRTFRGKYDGKERFEIDDSKASLKLSTLPTWHEAMKKGSSEYLGDILDHSELFKNYPDLARKVIVEYDAEMSSSADIGSRGMAYGDQMLLRINPSKVKTPKRMMEAILHEVQHAIQHGEDFAKGSSPQRGQAEIDEAMRIKDTPEARQVFGDDRIDRASRIRGESRKLGKDAAADRYRRSAGEIEARDVSARKDLSDFERQQTPPYSSENIDREDAIVRFMPGTSADRMSEWSNGFDSFKDWNRDRVNSPGYKIRSAVNGKGANYRIELVDVDSIIPSQSGEDYINDSSRETARRIRDGDVIESRTGDIVPIVLDSDGNIEDGNHRHAAATINGEKKILALVPSGEGDGTVENLREFYESIKPDVAKGDLSGLTPGE